MYVCMYVCMYIHIYIYIYIHISAWDRSSADGIDPVEERRDVI